MPVFEVEGSSPQKKQHDLIYFNVYLNSSQETADEIRQKMKTNINNLEVKVC